MQNTIHLLVAVIFTLLSATVSAQTTGDVQQQNAVQTAAVDSSQLPATNETGTVLININTASVEELSTLSNIGPARAALIVEYREQNGPFATIDDLVKVPKIGAKTLEANKASITVN
jgi:competence protein ComEA